MIRISLKNCANEITSAILSDFQRKLILDENGQYSINEPLSYRDHTLLNTILRQLPNIPIELDEKFSNQFLSDFKKVSKIQNWIPIFATKKKRQENKNVFENTQRKVYDLLCDDADSGKFSVFDENGNQKYPSISRLSHSLYVSSIEISEYLSEYYSTLKTTFSVDLENKERKLEGLKKSRNDALSFAIRQAISESSVPDSAPSVFSVLRDMAEKRVPPMKKVEESEILWQGSNGKLKKFDVAALRARMTRMSKKY